MKVYKFNGEALTDETVQKTKQWFHDNCLACIEEAKSGKVFVNNLESYIEYKSKKASEHLAGEHDNTFTFLQRAYYIQTGESVPMFSK